MLALAKHRRRTNVITGRSRAALSLMVLLLASTIQPLMAAQREVVISYFESPFQNMEKAIISEAYKNAGIAAEFVALPGKRSLLASSNGTVDAESNRIGAIDAKYPSLIQVPTPMQPLTGVSFSIRTDINIEQWDDLKPYTIGVLRGVPFYDKPTRQMHRVEVNSYHQLFSMLQRGRIDVVVGTLFSGQVTVKTLFPDTPIKVNGKPLLNIDTFHYIHEKNSDLVPLIDRQLKLMRESGRMAEIVEEQLSIQSRY